MENKNSENLNIKTAYYSRHTDTLLDSFHKRIEKDGEIPLGLSYLTESNHSNSGEEKSHYGLS